MDALAELAPWTVHSLGESPFEGFWPFNPSVVRTPDGRWLCSVRCANYHLPGSTTQAPRNHHPITNRPLVVTLDPATWGVTRAVEIENPFKAEPGGGPWNPALGFEDLRLVWTDGGLHATASALSFDVGTLEIVVLELDEEYQIVSAQPLRGPWSKVHQKNWTPYANADTLRLLYSVLGGGVHDRTGRIVPTHNLTRLESVEVPRGPARMDFQVGSNEITIRSKHARNTVPTRADLGLRGGTQVVEFEPGHWLGLAHGCQVGFGKYYWHRWYEVDFDGRLLSLSEPFKLSPAHGIEFAAGLALEPGTGRLVVSFGIEDDSAWIGETQLEPVLATLYEVEPTQLASETRGRAP